MPPLALPRTLATLLWNRVRGQAGSTGKLRKTRALQQPHRPHSPRRRNGLLTVCPCSEAKLLSLEASEACHP